MNYKVRAQAQCKTIRHIAGSGIHAVLATSFVKVGPRKFPQDASTMYSVGSQIRITYSLSLVTVHLLMVTDSDTLSSAWNRIGG
jgi:hypothetical protein